MVLALGCAPAARPQNAPRQAPAVWQVLGGDREFYGHERAAIALAASTLESQTRGCLNLSVDFDRDEPGDWAVWRHTSTDTATHAAEGRFGVQVYGWAILHEAHLVVDTCKTDRALTHTAMHELLHTLGVRHVAGNPNAVMAASASANTAPLELTREDREAIAAVIGCAW